MATRFCRKPSRTVAARGVLPGILPKAFFKAGGLPRLGQLQGQGPGCVWGWGWEPGHWGEGGSGAAKGHPSLKGAARLWGWSVAAWGPSEGPLGPQGLWEPRELRALGRVACVSPGRHGLPLGAQDSCCQPHEALRRGPLLPACEAPCSAHGETPPQSKTRP